MSGDENVYEGVEEESELQEQVEAPWEWVRQLDEMLVWLQGRWLPLSAVVLIASFLLFHAYAARIGILVGLTAVDVLTMMPFFFVLASFSVGACAIASCLPALLLTTPMEEKGDSILGGIYRYPWNSEPRLKAIDRALYGWMVAWVAAFLVSFSTFVFVVVSGDITHYKFYLIFFIGVASSFCISILYVRNVRIDGKKKIKIEFLMTLLGVSLIQTLMILLFISIGFEVYGEDASYDVGVAGVFVGSIIILSFLYFMQILVAAIFLKARKRYNLFKGAVSIGLAALLLFSMWPPLAGWLMTKTFVGDVSGARECAQLVWRPDSIGQRGAGLIDVSREYASVPVSVLVDIGGTLQVRPIGESKLVVYFVPVSELAAVEPCQQSADE